MLHLPFLAWTVRLIEKIMQRCSTAGFLPLRGMIPRFLFTEPYSILSAAPHIPVGFCFFGWKPGSALAEHRYLPYGIMPFSQNFYYYYGRSFVSGLTSSLRDNKPSWPEEKWFILFFFCGCFACSLWDYARQVTLSSLCSRNRPPAVIYMFFTSAINTTAPEI